MSKHMDLIDRISKDTGTPCGNIRLGMHEALDWLDQNPDQLPGRTITRSEYRDILNDAVTTSGNGDDWERGFCTGLTASGTKVAPDPEPTNAEKVTADLETWGIPRARALELGPWLAGQGWVKAPGGDDE